MFNLSFNYLNWFARQKTGLRRKRIARQMILVSPNSKFIKKNPNDCYCIRAQIADTNSGFVRPPIPNVKFIDPETVSKLVMISNSMLTGFRVWVTGISVGFRLMNKYAV